MAAIPMRCATRTRRAEDVQRRDFTINGLLLDPDQARELGPATLAAVRAGLLDYVGGLADLDAGIIRAIGEPQPAL